MWNVIDEDNAFDFEAAKRAQQWRAKGTLSQEIPPEKMMNTLLTCLVFLLGVGAAFTIAAPLFSDPAFIEAIKSIRI